METKDLKTCPLCGSKLGMNGKRARYAQRRNLAFKLQNPRLNQIHLHTFRHWKATIEYNRAKDILHVKQMLDHKSIENTLLYTQLVNFESEGYTTKVSKNLKEDCELIESGFE